jgi:hypothetical protein
MSNHSFKDKLKWYRLGLRQEIELAEHTDWTPDLLEQRRQHLVAFALGRWTLEDEVKTVVTEAA